MRAALARSKSPALHCFVEQKSLRER